MPSSSSIPSSSLFLSGEGDLDIDQKRELRLRSMTTLRDGNSKHGTDVGKRGDKFRIEVIHSEGTAGNDQVGDHEDLHGNPIEGDDDDDDDDGSWSCPPPICGVKPENNLHATNPSIESKIHQCHGDNNNSQKSSELLSDSSPSLMERMMAEASLARTLRKNEQEVTERNRVTKASFGMKKGFLNDSSCRNDGGKQKKRLSSIPKTNVYNTDANERSGDRSEKEQTTRNEEPIFELDDEGNMIPLPTPKPTPTNRQQQIHQEEIQTLRPNSNTNTTNNNSNNSLRFQEVQDALHQNSSTLTPNLVEKLSQNPKLMERLSDPETSEVLEALKEDPKGAMGRYKDRPEVMEFLGEFCGAIGECFSDLGAEQEKEENEKKEKEEAQRREEQNQKQNELGPMAKEALRKEERRKMDGGKAWDEDLNHKEREKLDGIVADRDVTAMLMDPDTQRVMQECSLPGRMHMYMQHPEYGPKLKKMIEVGLLKVA